MATILVADDRSHNREFLAMLLRYQSHRVIESKDGAEALDLARSEKPDLVISDILMPVMDGYELLRKLRADPDLAGIPVILWTAHYLEREARALAQQSGALDVLLKPSDPEEVLRVTQAALESSHATPSPGADYHSKHLELITTKLARKTDEAYWATLRLQALVEAIHQLALEKDPDRLIEVACNEARELIGSASAIVEVLSAPSSEGEQCCIRGAETRLDHEFCKVLRESETVRNMLHGQLPRRFPSPGESGNLELGLYGGYAVESMLSVPLQSAGKIWGGIFFLNKVGLAEFTEEDERIAVAFAAQIALAHESALLYQQVTHLNLDLTRLNAELRQYVNVAFHHLQEPLRSVQGFSQLLAARYRERLDSPADEFLDFIQAGVARMRSLVLDLGAYSQVASPGNSHCSSVPLIHAARSAVESCEPAIKRAGAQVTISDLPIVKGDAVHFQQVFYHLIDNAIKFRSEAAPVIEIRAEEDQGFHRISVRDNGIGIAREGAGRIFDIFVRLQGESSSGNGIGLALCKRIVERYGGSIWVESDGVTGSTLYFTLPAIVKNRE